MRLDSNVSTASAAFALVIDTVAPNAPTIATSSPASSSNSGSPVVGNGRSEQHRGRGRRRDERRDDDGGRLRQLDGDGDARRRHVRRG
jgi:hypothetical protein